MPCIRYMLKGPGPKYHTMLAKDVFHDDEKYGEWVRTLVARLHLWPTMHISNPMSCGNVIVFHCLQMPFALVVWQSLVLRLQVQKKTHQKNGQRTWCISKSQRHLSQRKKVRQRLLLSAQLQDSGGFSSCWFGGFMRCKMPIHCVSMLSLS